jgi:hypothetical protein
MASVRKSNGLYLFEQNTDQQNDKIIGTKLKIEHCCPGLVTL